MKDAFTFTANGEKLTQKYQLMDDARFRNPGKPAYCTVLYQTARLTMADAVEDWDLMFSLKSHIFTKCNTSFKLSR